jgi:hypothetical protein
LRKAGDEIRGALDQAVEAGQLSPAYLGCKRAPPTGAMVKPGAEKSPGSNRS